VWTGKRVRQFLEEAKALPDLLGRPVSANFYNLFKNPMREHT